MLFNWLRTIKFHLIPRSCPGLPLFCILCSHPTESALSICLACRQNLPILPQSCPTCAQVLSGTQVNTLCGACLKEKPAFEHCYALFSYEPPLSSLIVQLKFRHELSHARALGELLADRIQHDWYKDQPLPDLIIPVPLHTSRLQERGFNQAVEIAKTTGKILGIKVDKHGIKRTKYTVAQSSLQASERAANVAHAFTAVKDYSGLAVAILDDVMTTGHTLKALSTTLKKNGAKKITLWCCARRL